MEQALKSNVKILVEHLFEEFAAPRSVHDHLIAEQIARDIYSDQIASQDPESGESILIVLRAWKKALLYLEVCHAIDAKCPITNPTLIPPCPCCGAYHRPRTP